jgi:hypothetical protein
MAWATADSVAQVIAPSPRVTGSVLYAAVGTPLPLSSYATVNSTFEDLGYVNEAGLKNKEDRPQTDIFVWGGDLIASLQGHYMQTMQFTVVQFLDENVLAAGYGNSNITVTPKTSQQGKEIAVLMNSKRLDTLSWVFDGYYLTSAGSNALVRIVIPIGHVVQRGELNLTDKALASLDLTIKAFPDANGNHGYLYVNDGITTGATTGGS